MRNLYILLYIFYMRVQYIQYVQNVHKKCIYDIRIKRMFFHMHEKCIYYMHNMYICVRTFFMRVRFLRKTHIFFMRKICVFYIFFICSNFSCVLKEITYTIFGYFSLFGLRITDEHPKRECLVNAIVLSVH